jgi:hypothetical protein
LRRKHQQIAVVLARLLDAVGSQFEVLDRQFDRQRVGEDVLDTTCDIARQDVCRSITTG